nr:type VI secretion system contractile sheath large subunit [Xanthomonas citri]
MCCRICPAPIRRTCRRWKHARQWRSQDHRATHLILHDPQFQALDGAWRGLHYLVSNTESDTQLTR